MTERDDTAPVLDRRRMEALGDLLDSLVRDQEADGFKLFCILSEDKISMRDARSIVWAVKFAASHRSR